MQEESFRLETKDSKKIYGILTKAEKPAGKVIILAHGLTGWPNEHIHMRTRDLFVRHGYDVVRFAFYSAEDDARKLEDTTVQIHADDLNTICNHFRPNYKKLYIAGHSYGGLTLLMANPNAQGFAFWDATFDPFDLHWKERKKLEDTPYYLTGWGTTSLIGEAMYEEAKAITKEKAQGLAAQVKTPSLVILAGDNVENEPRTALYDALPAEKKLVDIEGADHCFCNRHVMDDLLKETLDWFEGH